jgi:hypothetical protein
MLIGHAQHMRGSLLGFLPSVFTLAAGTAPLRISEAEKFGISRKGVMPVLFRVEHEQYS